MIIILSYYDLHNPGISNSLYSIGIRYRKSSHKKTPTTYKLYAFPYCYGRRPENNYPQNKEDVFVSALFIFFPTEFI